MAHAPKQFKKRFGSRAYALTLIFLIITSTFTFFLATPTQATTLFSDGFESGDFSAWGWQDGTPSVQSSVKHCGSYAMYSDAVGDNTNYDLGSQSNVYVRFYWRSPTTFSNDEYQVFARVIASDFSTAVNVGVLKDGGGATKWFVEPPSGSKTYAATISPDTWYCIEVRRQTGSGDGIATLWVDGTQVVTATTETQATNAKYLTVGAPYGTGAAYIDCVVVADAYIGPEASSAYPYVNNVSDVDSVADIGTHSAFANQQALDSTYDTLTEADTDAGTSTFGKTSGSGSSYRTTAANEMRLGVFEATSTGEVASIVFYGRGASASQNCKAIITDSSGNLLTNGVGEAVSVSTTAGTKTLTFAAGSRPIVVSGTTYWIGLITAGAVRVYYDSTTGATSKQDTSNSYTTPTSPTDAGSTTETWRLMYANINNLNYRLAIEEQFTDIPTCNASQLCIYTGTLAAETLQVQGWNPSNSTWTLIGNVSTASNWNNFTVTNWINGSNFYIRFIDTITSNDATQSTWQIDAVYLYCYNSTSRAVTVFVLSETVSVTAALASQKSLLRGLSESVAVEAVLQDNKGLMRVLTQTVTPTDSTASNKALTKGLTASVAVLDGLGSAWGISRVLTATITAGDSFGSLKTLNHVFADVLSVVASSDATKALLKQLTETLSGILTVNAALTVQKGISNFIAETIQAIASMATTKSLLQSLTETLTGLLTITDALTTQKGLGRVFIEAVTVSDLSGFVKGLARVFASNIAVSVVLDSGKGILHHLTETLTGHVGIIDGLSVLKSLSQGFTESLRAMASLVSSKNILQHLSEALSASLNIADSLITSKALAHMFASVVSATSGLLSNVGLNHVFSEVFTGVVAPNAALVVQKGLSQIFEVVVSAGSGLIVQGNIILKALMFVLSEGIKVAELPAIQLTLSFAFLEFVDAVHIGDLLGYDFPLTAEEWFAVGAILASIIIGMLVFSLVMVFRKKDSE